LSEGGEKGTKNIFEETMKKTFLPGEGNRNPDPGSPKKTK
jgi:hypothetical protein